jgi:hypothetical protein
VTNPTEVPIRFYSFDTPLGPLMIMECRHPHANAERPDIPIGQLCPQHTRTIYLCLDEEALWCDGYLGGDEYAPHECGITVEDSEDLEL